MTTAPTARSLLRAELSSRRINHPHAAYASGRSNLLSCNICHLAIKSEALWEGHLRSANHRKNLERLQDGHEPVQVQNRAVNGEPEGAAGGRKRKVDEISNADDGNRDSGGNGVKTHTAEDAQISTVGGSGRKRKAEDDAEGENSPGTAPDGREERKKTKSESYSSLNPTLPASIHISDEHSIEGSQTAEPVKISAAADPGPQNPNTSNVIQEVAPPQSNPTPKPAPIDEAEWAAFERDVIPLSHQTRANPNSENTTATITISAPPMTSTTTTTATVNQGDKSADGKLTREEEAELDRLDEAQRLQDEFDLQDEMERRVQRLRERREGLRQLALLTRGKESGEGDGELDTGVEGEVDGESGAGDGEHGAAKGVSAAAAAAGGNYAGEHEAEGSEDDSDPDDWGFG